MDKDELAFISKHRPFACIHFAGLKAVGESIKPLLYYQNNLISTTNLLEILENMAVKILYFHHQQQFMVIIHQIQCQSQKNHKLVLI